jgi:bifunctional DNA-binding transcriptional regulator/antitoxin component of YhaV-PrlF toxin-antitoxin module
MKVDKDYRITLPDKNFRNHKVGEFVKVTVQKDESRVYFYLRVPKKCPSRTNRQVRRKLPTDLVEKLNVQLGDELKLVKVERTANQKQNQFNGNSFDLLSLRIEGIMQDPFTRDNEDWIRLWSSSKRGGITKQVELKRYIPINRGTGELFGLMQAENMNYLWVCASN